MSSSPQAAQAETPSQRVHMVRILSMCTYTCDVTDNTTHHHTTTYYNNAVTMHVEVLWKYVNFTDLERLPDALRLRTRSHRDQSRPESFHRRQLPRCRDARSDRSDRDPKTTRTTGTTRTKGDSKLSKSYQSLDHSRSIKIKTSFQENEHEANKAVNKNH